MNLSNWDSKIGRHENEIKTKIRNTQKEDNVHRNALLDSFINLRKTDLEVYYELSGILYEVRVHQMKKRISMTAGTSGGAVGAGLAIAGVFFAPATAGLSLLMTGSGLALSASSMIVAAGVQIGTFITNKDFKERIEALLEKQKRAVDDLTMKLAIINEVTQGLQNAGVHRNTALHATVAFSSRQQNFFKGDWTSERIIQIVRKILSFINELRAVAPQLFGIVAGTGDFTLNNGAAIATIANQVTQAMSTGLSTISKMVTSAGESIASTSGKIVLRSAAGAAVVFTVIDIGFLIHEWTSEHPLIDYIDNVVEKLEEDVAKCDEMITLIKEIESTYSIQQHQ